MYLSNGHGNRHDKCDHLRNGKKTKNNRHDKCHDLLTDRDHSSGHDTSPRLLFPLMSPPRVDYCTLLISPLALSATSGFYRDNWDEIHQWGNVDKGKRVI